MAIQILMAFIVPELSVGATVEHFLLYVYSVSLSKRRDICLNLM